jgi:hypothetical protein
VPPCKPWQQSSMCLSPQASQGPGPSSKSPPHSDLNFGT